jgi:hypothetical protein
MSKFKDALERGKEARRDQGKDARRDQGKDGRKEKAGKGAATADFSTAAKAWLNDVVVASLEAAKADVAGEITVDIDTARLQTTAPTPSVQFHIYRKQGPERNAAKTFTVSVQLDGGVSVSALGIVAKDVGNIGDRSNERFRNLLAELIEDAAKGT